MLSGWIANHGELIQGSVRNIITMVNIHGDSVIIASVAIPLQ